ncbi:MBL fold metallo-hydrolase [Patescibacteria group bacterium]|nr:MBL fold metallo-hydrolase [Patescibacteria group bacterium]MBU1472790.1 MBL fold metallo-hydrolase [Patescibacteria group bacterium]MBU2459735.1 MBL fold metallo-hydrolase [Patescibacteria group bacterium]MBU2544409.1 MBL fold metallo-hydrolase [Patescibacteria group bacterium]
MKNNIGVTRLVVGQLATNCYIYCDAVRKVSCIIDPGDAPEYISECVESLGVKPLFIIATHGHFDHILAAYALSNMYAIPFIMHKDDGFLLRRARQSAIHYLGIKHVDPSPSVSRVLRAGEALSVGEGTLHVLHTPGHTPGSISLYDQNQGILFTGDVLFKGGAVGRTDFAYGDSEELNNSVTILLGLPANTLLYSGHGDPSTVGDERGYHRVF